jgi:hypothetical protein
MARFPVMKMGTVRKTVDANRTAPDFIERSMKLLRLTAGNRLGQAFDVRAGQRQNTLAVD